MPLIEENALNSLTINLTNQCNSVCRHCFQGSSPKNNTRISRADIQRVLEFLASKQNAVKYIQLTGGEILTHSEFFEILKIVLFFGYTARLQTNGILLNDLNNEEMNFFSDPRVLTKISLDGWDERTHERLREKGSFNSVISAIKRLKGYSGNIGIKTVIHDLNFHNIQRMLELCLDLGVRSFSYNCLRPEGRAKRLFAQIHPASEIEVVKKLVPYFKISKFQHLLNGTWVMRYYRRVLEGSNKLREPGKFYIDFDGGIYPNQNCRKEEKIGSIFGDSLEKEFDFGKLVAEETVIPEGVLKCVKEIFTA